MSVDTALDLQVSLTVTCYNLPNKDVLSRSDPYAQLFMLDFSKQWKLIGRTETVKNTQSPRFTKEFVIPYKFEEEQLLMLRFWDDDYGQSRDDFLGETAPFKLGTLMGSRGQTLSLNLTENGKATRGSAFVHAEQADQSDAGDVLHFTFIGRNFDKKDGFFGKSDPYFVISATSNGVDFVDVYKSEVIKQNLNPRWQRASVPYRRVKGKMLKLQVTDWDKDGTHDLIGVATLKPEDILAKKHDIELVHPPTKSKYKASSYRNSGLVDVVECQLEKSYTMIDYLRGGLQINLMVAIDFTGSNGDPKVPGTLHYGGGQFLNNYIQAIQAVGNIVIEYDSDKLIPAFGFGAKPFPGAQVSHCFPLTGSHSAEQVWGVDGVLQAYTSCFQRGIMLSGPTYFSEIIRRSSEIASRNSNTYSILLLITDGEVNDVQQTIDAICDAAQTPLSIIIVGVGNASFTSMQVLDADVQPLVSTRGHRCARDIVQFVPFNQVVGSGDPSLLAKETLKELPVQLTQYCKLRGILPSPPINVQDVDIPTGPGPQSMPPPPIQTSGQVPPPPIASMSVPSAAVVAPPTSAEVGRIGRDLFNQAVSF